MPADLDPNQLRNEVNQMLEALTHPAYVEAMRTVRATPREERLQAGSRLLNPDALRQKGVPLPKNMRISSRYFDEDFAKGVDFGDKTAGGTNIINAMNLAVPGVLDRLSRTHSQLFDEISGRAASSERFVAVAGCCCGGAAGTCGGCG